MGKFVKQYSASILAAFLSLAVSAQAALPTYVGTAISDAQAQLTDLIAAMVVAAVAITLLALTPRVLIKMIRALGGKVSF